MPDTEPEFQTYKRNDGTQFTIRVPKGYQPSQSELLKASGSMRAKDASATAQGPQLAPTPLNPVNIAPAVPVSAGTSPRGKQGQVIDRSNPQAVTHAQDQNLRAAYDTAQSLISRNQQQNAAQDQSGNFLTNALRHFDNYATAGLMNLPVLDFGDAQDVANNENGDAVNLAVQQLQARMPLSQRQGAVSGGLVPALRPDAQQAIEATPGVAGSVGRLGSGLLGSPSQAAIMAATAGIGPLAGVAAKGLSAASVPYYTAAMRGAEVAEALEAGPASLDAAQTALNAAAKHVALTRAAELAELAPGVAHTALGGYFGIQGAKGAYDASQDTQRKANDPEGYYGDIGVNALMAGLGLVGAAKSGLGVRSGFGGGAEASPLADTPPPPVAPQGPSGLGAGPPPEPFTPPSPPSALNPQMRALNGAGPVTPRLPRQIWRQSLRRCSKRAHLSRLRHLLQRLLPCFLLAP